MKRPSLLLLAVPLLLVPVGCGGGTGLTNAPSGPGTGTGATSPGGSGGSGPSAPVVPPGYIDHVVIIVNENHTFDNLFAGFPGADTKSTFTAPDGTTFKAPHAPDVTRSMCHEHSCALTDWDGGKMDGWFQQSGANKNGDHMAWSQYQAQDIPGYWQLARTYGLADHFFSSMLGPSFPGHNFVLAAQAGWSDGDPKDVITMPIWGCDNPWGTHVGVENQSTCQTTQQYPCFDMPSVPDLLPKGVSWKFYGTGLNWGFGHYVWSMFDDIKSIRDSHEEWERVVPWYDFDDDIKNGKLPNVTWLVNQDLYSGHPPLSMCGNDQWVVKRVNEIMNSKYWAHTAIFITWDDFGGFYDHVKPPVQYGCDATHPYGLGFRLPLIIVSPYAKQGVFHGVTEQASLVKFIEQVFTPSSVGALHQMDPAARDDVAGSLVNAFDFSQTPRPPTPATTRCPAN